MSVHIKDKKRLQRKIHSIKLAGLSSLHVVSDFDRTLTRKDGFFGSSWSVIRKGNFLSEEYSKKCYEMFDYYYPIENDETLDRSFRSLKMKEWWEKALELLVEHNMSTKVVDNIISKYSKDLREFCPEFLNLLHKLNIPIMVFSAGLGDIIEGYFRKLGIFTDNVHIIANFLDYDGEGRAIGFKSDIVHVFNKSEVQLKDKDYLDKIKHRKNVILLGDSIGDLGMTKGIDHDTIIRIGFLNDNIQEKLAVYEDQFDVVILDDGSMEYVLDLLKEITEKD